MRTLKAIKNPQDGWAWIYSQNHKLSSQEIFGLLDDFWSLNGGKFPIFVNYNHRKFHVFCKNGTVIDMEISSVGTDTTPIFRDLDQ